MVWLIQHAALIMTDSGGLQKEAYFFKKHCITLRDETEWTELTEHRFNVLSGADREKIVELYRHYTFNDDFGRNLYGDGTAARTIVSELAGSRP
jgi:UDP-GlcNAc3NAcA epimerase